MKYFIRFFNRTSSVNDMNVKKMNFIRSFNASWGLEVLMKGLNFRVTPSKIPVDEIVVATELACNQLKDKSQAESLRNEVVKIVSKSKPQDQTSAELKGKPLRLWQKTIQL